MKTIIARGFGGFASPAEAEENEHRHMADERSLNSREELHQTSGANRRAPLAFQLIPKSLDTMVETAPSDRVRRTGCGPSGPDERAAAIAKRAFANEAGWGRQTWFAARFGLAAALEP